MFKHYVSVIALTRAGADRMALTIIDLLYRRDDVISIIHNQSTTESTVIDYFNVPSVDNDL